MRKHFTVIGYQWLPYDIYGHNHDFATKPLDYYVEADSLDDAPAAAAIRHKEAFNAGTVEAANFKATFVISGRPVLHPLW